VQPYKEEIRARGAQDEVHRHSNCPTSFPRPIERKGCRRREVHRRRCIDPDVHAVDRGRQCHSNYDKPDGQSLPSTSLSLVHVQDHRCSLYQTKRVVTGLIYTYVIIKPNTCMCVSTHRLFSCCDQSRVGWPNQERKLLD
jgi:hypothetical protein